MLFILFFIISDYQSIDYHKFYLIAKAIYELNTLHQLAIIHSPRLQKAVTYIAVKSHRLTDAESCLTLAIVILLSCLNRVAN